MRNIFVAHVRDSIFGGKRRRMEGSDFLVNDIESVFSESPAQDSADDRQGINLLSESFTDLSIKFRSNNLFPLFRQDMKDRGEGLQIVDAPDPLNNALKTLLIHEGCAGCGCRYVNSFEQFCQVICIQSGCSHIIHSKCLKHVKFTSLPHPPQSSIGIYINEDTRQYTSLYNSMHYLVEFQHMISSFNFLVIRGYTDPINLHNTIQAIKISPPVQTSFLPACRVRVIISIDATMNGHVKEQKWQHSFCLDGSRIIDNYFPKHLMEVSYSNLKSFHKIILCIEPVVTELGFKVKFLQFYFPSGVPGPPLVPVNSRTCYYNPTTTVSNITDMLPKMTGSSLCDYICTFQGSKDVQTCLDIDPPCAELLMNHLLEEEDAINVVACHVYGNYALQKLFGLCPGNYQEQIIKFISNAMKDIACNLQGSLTIQSMMTSSPPYFGHLFVDSLSSHSIQLIKHDQGTYVIQRCIETFPFSISSPIVSRILLEIKSISENDICDLLALTIRFIMDQACLGVRKIFIDLIVEKASSLSLTESGHLIVMHILLPLVNISTLNKLSNSMVNHHEPCHRCACHNVKSTMYLNYTTDRSCCCDLNRESLRLALSLDPAYRLIHSIEKNLASISLDKWGRKVVLRFFSLDSNMNISDLIKKVCLSLACPEVLVTLLNDRRGVKLILSIIKLLSREYVGILRKGLNEVILSDAYLDETSLGILSNYLRDNILHELNVHHSTVSPSVPLCLKILKYNPKIYEILQHELCGDWSPLCVSISNLEAWKSIEKVNL